MLLPKLRCVTTGAARRLRRGPEVGYKRNTCIGQAKLAFSSVGDMICLSLLQSQQTCFFLFSFVRIYIKIFFKINSER